MPVPDRIKQECKKSERRILLPYAVATFGFWQAAKYYGFDRNLGALGLISIMYLAAIHIAGEKNRPIVSIASILSLSGTALSFYWLNDTLSYLVFVVGFAIVILLASNLRRRQIVRDFSPTLRNWPN